MLVAGSTPSESGAPGGERLTRTGLGLLGALMCAGPPVATATFGWTAAALTPLVPIGALFVVLAAFYHRVAGEIRLASIRLTIGPNGTTGVPYSVDPATASLDAGVEISESADTLDGL